EVIIQNKVEKKLTLETKLIGELNTTRIAAGHEPLSIPHIYAMADKERTYKKIQDKTSTTSVAAPRKLTQEEIALEKARLQKLERVFAEKIKKLREIQNRKELTVAASKDSSYGAFQRLAEVKLQSANLKPAMIEYKKDKICFDFGNESDVDESQQSVKTRRKSLIELNPSTKPNLMSPNNEKSKTRIESTDITTDADNKSEITAIGKENKEAGKSRTSKISKKDVFAKKIFSMPSDSQLERLKRLQKEKEQVVKFDPMWVYVGRDNDYINVRKLNLDIPVAETVAKQSVDDGEIVSYKPYKSTLLHFKTYRFNPYYRTKCKLSLSSPSFSNRLNPRRVLCSFDLKGTCNDEKCPWQHSDDYELTTDGLYKDIVSYAPKLAGIDDSTNIADCDKKLTSYIETIKKQKLKIMNTDQLSLWFVSKVNEHYSRECLDRALNVLSRSLESNGSSVELWQHYLTLYSKRVKSEELREMCQEAVQFAPHYDLWWKCLQLEKTFSGKDSLCKKILDFLVKQQEELSCHLQSHQILEVLLYRVHLHVQSRRYNIALNIFNGALSEKVSSTSSHSHYIAKYLTGSDRCLAWLSFIYLTQFHTLPPSLYDPVNNNPGKIVNKEPFILPWTESSELNPEVLLSHFQ
ncbi:zinc finger C3H1 domain-containing protein-like, partial [Saccoglossus kowalevskii]|uniref:Zinc finger C3H1 domain-containing protein-like n=1 Tax=Saccoglossus kowalevskii TaxID=10224 RepID=A0ABM0MYH0_SACKO